MRRVHVGQRGTRNRKGAVLVLVAMMMVMLLAFVGLTVDLARMYASKAILVR